MADTHTLLIMDRSAEGSVLANKLLDSWAPVGERLDQWRALGDAFFVFILEHKKNGRAGSMTARDLDALLTDVLPKLFENFLLPPAVPGIGVVTADELTSEKIGERIEELKAAASATTRH